MLSSVLSVVALFVMLSLSGIVWYCLPLPSVALPFLVLPTIAYFLLAVALLPAVA